MNRPGYPHGRVAGSDIGRQSREALTPPSRDALNFPAAITQVAKTIDSQSRQRLSHPAMAEELTLEDCTRTYDHTELSRLLQVATLVPPHEESGAVEVTQLADSTRSPLVAMEHLHQIRPSVADSYVGAKAPVALPPYFPNLDEEQLIWGDIASRREAPEARDHDRIARTSFANSIHELASWSASLPQDPPATQRCATRRHPSAPRNGRMWFASMFVVLSVCFLGVALWMRLGEARVVRWQGRTTGVTPATALLSRPQAEDLSPRLIDLHVEVDPKDARVYLDGRAASNPLRVAYPADDATHVIRAEAEGREPRELQLKLDRDVSVVLGLPER